MHQPTIVEKARILAIGLSSYATHENAHDIPLLWDHFVPQMNAIPNHINPTISFGISCFPQNFSEHRKWTYTAAVEVSSLEDIPFTMSGLVLPAHRYAVFTHRGPINKLPKFCSTIYRDWLPASPWQAAQPYAFELYDERFTPDNEESSEVDLYIPIVEQ